MLRPYIVGDVMNQKTEISYPELLELEKNKQWADATYQRIVNLRNRSTFELYKHMKTAQPTELVMAALDDIVEEEKVAKKMFDESFILYNQAYQDHYH